MSVFAVRLRFFMPWLLSWGRTVLQSSADLSDQIRFLCCQQKLCELKRAYFFDTGEPLIVSTIDVVFLELSTSRTLDLALHRVGELVKLVDKFDKLRWLPLGCLSPSICGWSSDHSCWSKMRQPPDLVVPLLACFVTRMGQPYCPGISPPEHRVQVSLLDSGNALSTACTAGADPGGVSGVSGNPP